MKLSDGFELLATASDGLARLRELIFSLAVQGKLLPEAVVERFPNVVSKELKTDKSQTTRCPSDAPYLLPSSWRWVRLGDVLTAIGSGWSPACVPEPQRTRDDWAVLKTTAVQVMEYQAIENKRLPPNLVPRPELEVKRGDILITRAGPKNRVGVCCVVDETPPKLMISDKIIRVHIDGEVFEPSFAVLSLNAGWSRDLLEAAKSGMAESQMNISQRDLQNIVLPLPGKAEQVRIVAKVDELMRLCDELETRGRLETEQHAQLTATLFDALAASESAHALAENWARVAAHFDLLLDRPEAVDALEQIIVHLAVRGLLVPQVPNDEQASELLQKVRQEKDRLIAEGATRRDKPLQQVDENSLPYEAPNGWVWARFGAVILDSEAGWSPSCENVPRESGQWGVLKVSAVSWGKFRPEENKELPAGVLPKPEYEVMSGDFLLSRANTDELVARSVVVEATEPKLMMSDKIIRLNLSALVDPQYLNLFNNSMISRGYYVTHASGTSSSMKNVSRDVVLNLPVALPPAAEQSRIVARVQELRGLCANLRDRLIARQSCQARFAEAMVEQNESAAVPLEETDALAAAA